MPFTRPNLQTLITRTQNDVDSRIEGAEAKIRRTFLNVFARVLARTAHGLYGFIQWLSLQIVPDTAEDEFLERWASVWGVVRVPAVSATGPVTFTGNGTVPAGAVLQRADGVEFAVDADVIVVSSTAGAVTAVNGGVDGNVSSGTSLNLVSPVSGISGSAVAGDIIGGLDEQSDVDLKAFLLRRIQQPPHGGADFDYVAWAFEVPGVTRAWVFPLEFGIGTVMVLFMMDDLYADGIPQPADVMEVDAYIDTQRPVTATLFVQAPVAVPLAMSVQLTPNTVEVQAAVQAEIDDLILREAVPGGPILISHIREAISIAAGETDHVLVSPVADVTHLSGEIAVPQTITWL